MLKEILKERDLLPVTQMNDGSAATNKRGMGIELDKAYAPLEVETQGMDKVCLGCNNRGVRFRTA